MFKRKSEYPPRVVVVGSSNTDLVLDCPRLPKPGESVIGGEFKRFAGGKGANQAVAAARAGATVAFVGAHGRDDFGRLAKKNLKKEGIDVRHFREHPDVSSGIAFIFLGGKNRENLIGVARSANDTLSGDDVVKAKSVVRRAGVVLAQLEMPPAAVRTAADLANEYGVPFLLNPAPARKLPRALLRRVHTLTPNETEAAFLTGESDPKKAARKLVEWGCRQVIVTLGAKGAWVVTADGAKRFPAQKVKPVDTVGAGDCFNGWLAAGIAEGLPIEEAVPLAIRAASIAVTRFGAQAGMPQRAEVLAVNG